MEPGLSRKTRHRTGLRPLTCQADFHSWEGASIPSPSLLWPVNARSSLQVCAEKWNLLNSSRLHLSRPSAVALEVQRLNALDREKRIGKSILGKVW